MKNKATNNTVITKPGNSGRRGRLTGAALLALGFSVAMCRADEDRPGKYVQANLVSDQAGMALLQDTNLVNAWGISSSPNSPFWVSSNGKGLAVLYAVTNNQVSKRNLEVTIPGEGTPTGQLFDGTGSF